MAPPAAASTTSASPNSRREKISIHRLAVIGIPRYRYNADKGMEENGAGFCHSFASSVASPPLAVHVGSNELGAPSGAHPGFLGGRLLRNARNVFWTITAWEDAAAMNRYRTAGAHRRVMPKLLIWCDEAAVVHWNQESSELPSWQEAHQHRLDEGKPSKVNYPSPAHVANDILAPKPSRIEQTVKPSVSS